MFRPHNPALILLGSIAIITACKDATAPADTAYVNPPGTYMASAVAVIGPGDGGVSVTPKAIAEAYFTAEIKVRLRKAMPNTVYTVQRAPEIGRASSSNGVCERALGVAPWSSADAPAPAFVTFVLPGQTTPVTLTTNASGDGTVDFAFSASTIPAGTRFDVMFRIVNDLTAPTSVIISQCFTVTAL